MARRHWRLWGRIGLETARGLNSLPDNALLDVTLAWDAPRISQEELVSQLQTAGARQVRIHRDPDLAFFVTSKAELLAAIPWAEYTRKLFAHPLDQEISLAASQTSSTSRSDIAFNSNGFFGQGVKVGILEAKGYGAADSTSPCPGEECGCRIWDEHIAFSELTPGLRSNVTYMFENPIPCGACDYWCGAPELPGECSDDGYCISPHTHYVASRTSSTNGEGPQHAGRVALYVANNFSRSIFGGTSWSVDELVGAYDWFKANRVRYVNESWVTPFPTARGAIVDWYTRYGNMTVVQAAGNSEYENGDKVGCEGLNSICVGGAHAGAPDDFTTWNWYAASYANQYGEVERPDVLAEGGDSEVASIYAADEYESGYSGTSFAAPVVTGVLALLEEACGPMTATAMRSRLRSAGWDRHNMESGWDACPTLPADPFYPTPEHGCDYHAGIGPVAATGLAWWCDPNSDPGAGGSAGGGSEECTWDHPCHFEFGDSSSPGVGWSEPESYMVDEQPDIISAYTVTAEQALRQPDRLVSQLFELGPKPVGMRLRATYAYQSCPLEPGSVLDQPVNHPWSYLEVAPAVNFDLIACGYGLDTQSEYCFALSQSLHDTVEGFDVVLQEPFEYIRFFKVAPAEWSSCGDAFDERAHFTVIWWTP